MTEEKIIAHLFAANSLSDVEIYRIEETITRYPYFALPRYWLAKKELWQDQSRPDASTLPRARLFADNPFLFLQYLHTPFDDVRQEADIREAPAIEAQAASSSASSELSESTAAEAFIANIEPSSQSLAPEAQEASETPISLQSAEVPAAPSKADSGQEPAEEGLSSPWVAPLYTRDYFAYAGISLAEEEADLHKPTSAQMKSFTEWLRSTRRPLHSTDPDASEDDDASESHTEPSFRVITESMANIWLQQGQPQKAIEILEQLRLLNPEKSDYFAQRIASIRNQI
ncbi:hypothetical protein [Thermoflavifilum thermophilum]|uniref:Tetratricopeptide repeat-containing protein n=1 Tax=Thermoflavifilum thermophilum TaxID=1393122 RepID=A0A1I7N054_9BACT|nr:hypothetical protein [Thermoflavifilum thermophilum]SFV27985.1 hypothetical protein SAMN05660895_0231 [Thermoflavifilum thermophilum]